MTSSPHRRGAALARFFELCGHHIIEGAGALWYDLRPHTFLSLPYQDVLSPNPADLNALIRANHALAVRFPSWTWEGVPGGLYVCSNQNYDLSALSRPQRAKVRKGLSQFEFRTVAEAELLAQGIELNRDTLQRQNRSDATLGDAGRWAKLVKAVFTCEAMTTFGAFQGTRLTAYVIGCQEDGWLHLLYKASRDEHLDLRPNYALDFWILQNAARDPRLVAVSNGFLSLSGGEGVREYKRRLGYEVVAHHTAIVLHPAMAAVLTTRPALRVASLLHRLSPSAWVPAALAVTLQAARVGRLHQVERRA